MTTVAVCIPTYNQCVYLEKCLDSILSQVYPVDEIWISDDNSSDDTSILCRDYESKYSNINYIKQPTNLGMSGNPRWLLQQPKTDFIAKLDSDDFYHSQYLSSLIPILESDSSLAYAHSSYYSVDCNSQIIGLRQLIRGEGIQSNINSLLACRLNFNIAANILVFRRSALESVDFLKPDLQFCDDWDLGVRLASKGWSNYYSSKILAYYRVWDDEFNSRSRRRLDQVICSNRVIEEELISSYIKWNLDLKVIARARLNLAINHCLLPCNNFTKEAKEELANAIYHLSDKCIPLSMIRLLMKVLNPLPLIITESVASGGHGTSLPMGKEKGVFLQEERCPPNDQVFI